MMTYDVFLSHATAAAARRRGSDPLVGSNAVDDEHFQAFGGDLLERRALANVSYEW